MKKLAIVVLLASPAFAGTLTLTTTAPQDTIIETERVFENTKTCTGLALAAGCTQGQARAAYCLLPGASQATPPCTVNGVSSNTVRIYSDANDYGESLIKAWAFSAKQLQDARKLEAFAAWRLAATAAQRNAVCTAAGFPNGCLP